MLVGAFAGAAGGAVHHLDAGQARLGSAAVLPSGVCAGTIESSSGSASDTPMPRRTVRRERCFFVMNCTLYSSCLSYCCAAAMFVTAGSLSSALRIWNGALFTMPRTNDEKRLLLRAASRSMARTTGMS